MTARHRWASGVCAAALLASVVGTGCVTVSGGDPDQSVQTYIFAPELPEARAGSGDGTVLLVAPPDAAAGYGSRFMIYTRRPAELNWYAFAEWADGPPRMLQTLLVRALDASGRFGAVVDISAGVLADLRLDSEIVTLQHEIESEGSSRVRVILRVQMVDLRSRSVLANRLFEVTEPAPSNNARGAVTATNQALGELLVMVTQWAGDAAGRRAAPPRGAEPPE